MVENVQDFTDHILASGLKAWLRPSDASINLVNASKLRYSDTGRCFLESDHYKWLKNTSGARLWLRGISGCGKTVLSSTIIEDLRSGGPATETAVIYLFFLLQRRIKAEARSYAALPDLSARWMGWISYHLLTLMTSSSLGNEQPRTMQLVEIFNQMASEPRNVIVVLDALDESEERHDLLRWITSFSNQTCKFNFTRCWEIDIEKAFAS